MLGVGYFVHHMNISLVLNVIFGVALIKRSRELKLVSSIRMLGISISNNINSRMHQVHEESSSNRLKAIRGTRLNQPIHNVMMNHQKNLREKITFLLRDFIA